MKTTLLSLLFFIFLLSIACDDDPINNDDDKLVETLEDYRIAYSARVNDKSIVYICDVDGTNHEMLFEDAFLPFAPYDSVAYMQSKINGACAYNFISKDTTYPIVDEEAKTMWIRQIPNSEKILMGTKAFERGKSVYIANSDGTGKEIFSDDCPGASILFSRDETQILLEDNLKYDVWNIDGSNKREVMELDLINSLSWHNDGRRLIWCKPIDRTITNIEFYDIGSGLSHSLITLENGPHFNAKMSPNGQKIAFHDKSNNLYLINPDGSGFKTLRDGGEEIMGDRFVWNLEWAPDSRHILVSKVIDMDSPIGAGGLEVINTQSGTVTPILNEDISYTAFWVKVK